MRVKQLRMEKVCARIDLWDFLILVTPFTSGLYTATPAGNIYLQYIVFAVFLFRQILIFRTLPIPQYFLLGLGGVTSLSLIGNVLFSVPLNYLLSYLPPLVLTYLAYFAYLKENRLDLELVLRKYFSVAMIVSSFAVCQQLLYIAGSDALLFTADILKVSGPIVGVVGLSSEPSNIAVALAPAVFLALHSLLVSQRFSVGATLILLTEFMTISALGYLVLLLSLAMLAPVVALRRPLYFVLALPFALYAITTLVSQEHFVTRLQDTTSVVYGDTPLDPAEVNLSTYALVVNYEIVRQALFENGLLGVGMGAYPEVFDEYVSNFETPSYRESLPGRGTATSLFLKVTAEFGIIGAVAAIWFLFSKLKFKRNEYINHAFFVTLVVVYLRLGFYYINGIPFFVLMYLYSYKPIPQQANAESDLEVITEN